jgi:hypothetical protein
MALYSGVTLQQQQQQQQQDQGQTAAAAAPSWVADVSFHNATVLSCSPAQGEKAVARFAGLVAACCGGWQACLGAGSDASSRACTAA